MITLCFFKDSKGYLYLNSRKHTPGQSQISTETHVSKPSESATTGWYDLSAPQVVWGLRFSGIWLGWWLVVFLKEPEHTDSWTNTSNTLGLGFHDIRCLFTGTSSVDCSMLMSDHPMRSRDQSEYGLRSISAHGRPEFLGEDWTHPLYAAWHSHHCWIAFLLSQGFQIIKVMVWITVG
jgi:hypothetical protein